MRRGTIVLALVALALTNVGCVLIVDGGRSSRKCRQCQRVKKVDVEIIDTDADTREETIIRTEVED